MTFLLLKGNVQCRWKGLFDFVICNARKIYDQIYSDRNLELARFSGNDFWQSDLTDSEARPPLP